MPLSEGSGFRALAIEQGPPVATPVSGYGVPLVQCAREVSDREPLSPPLQPVDQAGDSNPAAARRVSRRDGGVRVRVDGEAAGLDLIHARSRDEGAKRLGFALLIRHTGERAQVERSIGAAAPGK